MDKKNESFADLAVIEDKASAQALVVKKKPDNRMQTFYRLLSLARPEYPKIIIGFLALIVNSVTNLSFPWLLGNALDRADMDDLSTVLYTSAGYFVAGSIASWLRVYCLGTATESIANRLRLILFDSLLDQEMEYYEYTQVGELVSLLEKDIEVAAQSLTDTLAAGLRSLNSSINGSYFLYKTSPTLCAVTLSTVPIVGIGAMSLSRYSRKYANQLRDLQSNVITYSMERIRCISTVRLNHRESYEKKKFAQLLNQSDRCSESKHFVHGSFMSFLNLATNGALIVVLQIGGQLIAKGQLTPGSLTSFAIQSGFVGLGFSGLSTFYNDMIKSLDAASRVFSVIDQSTNHHKHSETPVVLTQISSVPSIDPYSPLIQNLSNQKLGIHIENVSFAYKARPENTIIDNLSITIRPCSINCFVGKSGSGKSTLAALLCGLHHPTHGAIQYGDLLVSSNENRISDETILFSLFGVVEQSSTTLMSGTIGDNIEYGKLGATQEEIEQAAKDAHAHDFIMTFPQKYETQVGDSGSLLSGGQRARIAIARALIKRPHYLLLDEPTAALDAESEKEIIPPLLRLKETTTIILFTHSEALKSIADFTYELGKKK